MENKKSAINSQELNKELEVRQKAVEEKEKALEEKVKALDKREKSLEEREAKIEAAENALQASPPLEEKKTEPGLRFSFRGQAYKFKDDAPKTIHFAGEIMHQKQLIEDEDLLVQLVGGNVALIEKI